MIRKLSLTILILQFASLAEAQNFLFRPDSLTRALNKTRNDTTKVLLMAYLGNSYAFSQVDTAISYAQRAISLARQLNYKKGEAVGLASYGWALWASGNYDKAIEMGLKSLNLYKTLEDIKMIASLYNELTVFYRDAGDYRTALNYGFLSKNLIDSLDFYTSSVQIGSVYLFLNQVDSASFYFQKLYEFEKKEGRYALAGYPLNLLGDVEAKRKKYAEALNYYRVGISIAFNNNNNVDIVFLYNAIAGLYHETGNIDSSIYYAKEVLSKSRFTSFQRGVFNAFSILAEDYKLKNKKDSVIKYLELSIALNDSLFNKEKTRTIQNLTFNEQLQQQEIEAAKIQYQNQVKLYAMLVSLIIFLLIAFILWRNNRRKQKLNILLQKQKGKIENTLMELRATQSQLIHSEKMASLGELTAGIAHEIQNPLNFVNNFSDVNKEMLEELKAERLKPNAERDESLQDDLINDVIANEEKINHHGKRADAIVKGMLQHSRQSSGQKEPTDINALADEYLRLSYHGMRAKDKSFNVDIKTDFDESIGKINIIPQDIGRVLLNLFNNAFYAVSKSQEEQGKEFEPTVSVSTKKSGNTVLITVSDNGNGIPQKIIDKIFQPFFTTKPTGQGTGLGLSLSYDIIKAHGGEIKVESKEGEGSEFVIQLHN
ncbi:MAG: ATP-binding protein [Ginsengibacter sp.]